MTPREERGLVIAATLKLTQKGKVWLVPSQNGKGRYTVHPDAECPFCSCPDHEETGLPCKHIYAVRVTMQREHGDDGVVTEVRQVTFTEKKTYKQDWPLYNLAQIEEKKRFLVLLRDLCRDVPEPPLPPKGGRLRTPIADMVFATCLKVYTTLSGRRNGMDMEDAHAKGFLSKKLHPLMTNKFLENKLMTPVLKQLVEQSALPLRAVETTFAPDSTGFSTSRFVRWFDEKYGRERSGRNWVKVHAICGVKTNIVTAVEIGDRNAGDCPMFKPLVETTVANGFNVERVPADKAYLSNENLELVDRLGGIAYVPFKINSTPGMPGSMWERMYLYYRLNREDFDRHYHQRSNVESTFSMVKAKFRDHVRATSDVAMKNEVLAKLLCHNICCVIMSQIELGIAPVFWPDAPTNLEVVAESPAAPAAVLAGTFVAGYGV